MSATLKTENYDLPIFAPEDFTSWKDYNAAMEIIDAAMEENKNNIGDLDTGQGAANQAIASINENISTINTSLKQQNTAISELATRMANNESHDEDRDVLIGNIQKEINSSNSTIETQLTDISNSVKTNQSNISNLSNEVLSINNSLKITNEQVNQNKNEISNLESQISNINIGTQSVKETFNQTNPLFNFTFPQNMMYGISPYDKYYVISNKIKFENQNLIEKKLVLDLQILYTPSPVAPSEVNKKWIIQFSGSRIDFVYGSVTCWQEKLMLDPEGVNVKQYGLRYINDNGINYLVFEIDNLTDKQVNSVYLRLVMHYYDV